MKNILLSLRISVLASATHSDLSQTQKKDRRFSYDRSIHFHGNSVLILEQGTLKNFKKENLDWSKETLSNRIFKDTISIPKDGYTIVRFQASNSG